jgi:hypothetical protein
MACIFTYTRVDICYWLWVYKLWWGDPRSLYSINDFILDLLIHNESCSAVRVHSPFTDSAHLTAYHPCFIVYASGSPVHKIWGSLCVNNEGFWAHPPQIYKKITWNATFKKIRVSAAERISVTPSDLCQASKGYRVFTATEHSRKDNCLTTEGNVGWRGQEGSFHGATLFDLT